MALFLNIVQGPLTGDKYEIFDGLKLGRSKGHIKLNDPKSSTLHAKIELIDGKFILKDQGSKNGVRVGKEKLAVVVLDPGTEFVIGSNHFQVESDGEEAVATQAALPADSATQVVASPAAPAAGFDSTQVIPSKPLERPASEPSDKVDIKDEVDIKEVTTFKAAEDVPEEVLPEPERRTWSDVLADWATQNADVIRTNKRPIAALDPVINLVFLRGLQAETTWTLGYGPRTAGPRSLDLPIFEPNAPDPCFEILPTPSGIQFKTFHADQVLLNGKSVATKELQHGDQITILNSLIEVEFVK